MEIADGFAVGVVIEAFSKPFEIVNARGGKIQVTGQLLTDGSKVIAERRGNRPEAMGGMAVFIDQQAGANLWALVDVRIETGMFTQPVCAMVIEVGNVRTCIQQRLYGIRVSII